MVAKILLSIPAKKKDVLELMKIILEQGSTYLKLIVLNMIELLVRNEKFSLIETYFLDWMVQYLNRNKRHVLMQYFCVKYLCDLINSSIDAEQKILKKVVNYHLEEYP